MLHINKSENNITPPKEMENDFDKEHFYILDEGLEYYTKSKTKKNRGCKFRSIPLSQAS